jgi:hypothetical protein
MASACNDLASVWLRVKNLFLDYASGFENVSTSQQLGIRVPGRATLFKRSDYFVRCTFEGVVMCFHAQNGSDFVGLRSIFGGRRQVVYDARAGKRVVLDIYDASATDHDINAALKEGINARNVLGGVLAALKARNIDVDFAP